MPRCTPEPCNPTQSIGTMQPALQEDTNDLYTFDPNEDFDWLNRTGAAAIKEEPDLLVGRMLQLATSSLAKVLNVMEEDVDACQKVDAIDSAVASTQLRFTLALLDKLRTYVIDNLSILQCQYSSHRHKPNHTGAGSDLFDDLKRDLDFVLARIDFLRTRCDTIATTLLSTMSILESQKSIEQSRQVNQLTKLAFFYIPLSFVSSVFGMNVKEIQTNPPIWVFFVTAVSFTLLSILVASWQEIKRRLKAL
jgi:Mg2+ and Co2+ transporter CorA